MLARIGLLYKKTAIVENHKIELMDSLNFGQLLKLITVMVIINLISLNF